MNTEAEQPYNRFLVSRDKKSNLSWINVLLRFIVELLTEVIFIIF
jgi:hypothetical protein